MSTLLHRLVLLSSAFIYPMSGRYSTNWDRVLHYLYKLVLYLQVLRLYLEFSVVTKENRKYIRGEFTRKNCITAIFLYCLHTAGVLGPWNIILQKIFLENYLIFCKSILCMVYETVVWFTTNYRTIFLKFFSKFEF